MKIKFYILAGILAMALAATPAFAFLISSTIPLGVGNSPALDNYTGNFATLTISVDDGGGPAFFDLQAGSGQIVGQPLSYVKYGILGGGWFFGLNVTDTSGIPDVSLTNFVVTKAPFSGDGPGSPIIVRTTDQKNIDGFGKFNLELDSPDGGSGSAFQRLTFETTQTFSNLADFEGYFKNNDNGYFTAVDIGVFTGDYTATNVTGFAGNGENDTQVPIPPSALLLGSGLLGLVGLGWRRRKTNV